MKLKNRAEVIQFYEERIDQFADLQEQYRKKEKLFPIVRVVLFLAPIFVGIWFYSILTPFLYIIIALLVILFFLVVYFHRKMIEKVRRYEQLIKINEKEYLSRAEHDYHHFEEGSEFLPDRINYLTDLDIFGPNSIYQYLNRTTTAHGQQFLVEWLKNPASKDTITNRQEGATELADLVDWRQNFLIEGDFIQNQEPQETHSLYQWLSSSNSFARRNFMTFAVNGLTVLINLSLLGFIIGFWPVWPALLVFIFNMALLYRYRKDVSRVHSQVSRVNQLLYSYHRLCLLIERQDFNTSFLQELQAKLMTDGKKASSRIKQLSNIVHAFNYRFNDFAKILLNVLLLWDLRCLNRAERWEEQNSGQVRNWFDSIGTFDALNSLANLTFNHPGWTFPAIVDDQLHLRMKEGGHPLLTPSQRVTNDFSVDSPGVINIITGANMSGKSTFLKTIGVNFVLGLSGAPVCTRSMEIPVVSVYTSMQTDDDLSESVSSFRFELQKIDRLLKRIQNGEKLFVLFDEVFKTTNPKDKLKGSQLLIEKLIELKVPTLIATHDLELTRLEETDPDHVLNYYFPTEVRGKEMQFEYKIKRGVCQNTNAALLIKRLLDEEM